MNDPTPTPPRVRVRMRPAEPAQDAPNVRVRMRPCPEPKADTAPPKNARRAYTQAEAKALAGTPEDPIARGLYSNTAMATCSTLAKGRGDNTVGKYMRVGEDAFMVWIITLDGRLAYKGLWRGSQPQVFDRMMQAGRAIAQARSSNPKAPILYEEWRGTCAPRKKAA